MTQATHLILIGGHWFLVYAGGTNRDATPAWIDPDGALICYRNEPDLIIPLNNISDAVVAGTLKTV